MKSEKKKYKRHPDLPRIAPKNNGKHPGGCPKKYTEEYLSELAKIMLAWFKKKDHWWLKEFAVSQGFHSSRLPEFARMSQEFSVAYNLCRDIQQVKLVKKGFQPYKDRFASFVLKNITQGEWRDHVNDDAGGLSEQQRTALQSLANKTMEEQI